MAKRRIGCWFLGAKGGVATTSIVGAAALKLGLAGNDGLVSCLPEFAGLDFFDWADLIIGGHEIRNVTLHQEALKLHQQSRALDPVLIENIRGELDAIDKNIRPGVLVNVGPTIEKFADEALRTKRETPRAAVERVQADLKEFQKNHALDQVLLVNVTSTEPPVDESKIPPTWNELSRLLDQPGACPLAASSLYAIAALDLGFPFVNFTPSLGSSPAAIRELAVLRNTCHMGHDGKTGETLLKSVLAPMFAHRNLPVMSWVGHNIFGNMDGLVLDDPANKKSKVRTKDKVLGGVLGYQPQTLVSIEYIASLGDWKTAWDHIHFRGFLGTQMILQFTWQGCDSLLAAPLVLDLLRFTELAHRRGERGLLTFLASFFKTPLGVDDHDFHRQFQMLQAWAGKKA